MATRRQVYCGIVANVLCATSLSIVALLASCAARDDVATGRTDSGSLGGDGDDGGGDGGSSGATIACNPTGTGCLCIAGDSQPGQLAACSPASVAQNAMEHGVCCVAVSLCACIRYTCRSDTATSFCQCGSVLDLASLTIGTQVAECPPPMAGEKCCFSQDNATCICSRLACAAEEAEVPNCSAAAAGACRSGEEIAACR
jgi:hypothetical protein